MHEYSIVSSLIGICEKQAKKANAKAVKSVTISVGKLSGIEPHFMESCFDVFKENTICNDAVLVMNILDIKIYCNACKSEHIITNNNFFCPSCHSPETDMIEGEEMLVQSIEIFN